MADSSVEEFSENSTRSFLTDILTEEEQEIISNCHSKKAASFIEEALSFEERSVIRTGRKDEAIIAVIKKIREYDAERFREFDRFVPRREYRHNYILIQRQWLVTEYYFLGNPDNRTLLDDLKRHYNAERFKAFYVIKYPERVERGFRIDDLKR